MSLSVAVIGAGYFSRFHLEGWASNTDVHVAALCDIDKGRRELLSAEFGVANTFHDAQTMIEQVRPDILDIVTPPQTHLSLVKLAASYQLTTICQKPLAPDMADAQKLVETAKNAGITLVVHENFRFSPWYRECKRLIDAGLPGSLHGISFRLRPGDGQGPEAYLARQPYFQTMPRFLVHETAIHFIDTFRYLCGEVQAVTARLRRLNPVMAGEDAGYILFDFIGGSTGLFDGNRLNEHPANDLRRTMGEMWLEGREGVIRLDGDGRLFWKAHGKPESRHRYDEGPATFAGGACARLQQHVTDHLLRGQPLENSAVDYLRNLVIEEAIYESSDTGRCVTLP
ncbi:MAG: Gfo/Idh/MocA family protein [Granulosicoccus sp.]